MSPTKSSPAERLRGEVESTERTERVYRPEPFDVVPVPIGKINVCGQHRNGSNPIQPELNKSVGERGLIHQLTVTVLDREQTSGYIEFTNRVWQGDARLEDFEPLDESGEHFVILVAGHSRLDSCYAHAETLGYEPHQYLANARILENATTVDEIIAWQTEENIHAVPPPQNTAKLLAESWLWLKAQEAAGGPRVSQKEFARRHRVGEHSLRNALRYVELPPNIRGLTDEGLLPYHVAVEVGKAMPTVAEYAAVVDPDHADELFETELFRLASCYLRHEKILMAVGEIRARVDGFRDRLGADDAEQPALENFMELVEEPSTLELARRRLAEELRETRGRIQRGQIGLQNAIANLARVEGAGVDPALHAETVQDATELLEGETVRLG